MSWRLALILPLSVAGAAIERALDWLDPPEPPFVSRTDPCPDEHRGCGASAYGRDEPC